MVKVKTYLGKKKKDLLWLSLVSFFINSMTISNSELILKNSLSDIRNQHSTENRIEVYGNFSSNIQNDSINIFSITTLHLKINWNKKGQVLEGFGVFAGRENVWYESKFRNEILEYLFSLEKGLGLSIIRGQIYPDFYLQSSKNKIQILSQIWIFKHAKKYFSVDKFFLSSWSPPYEWKTLPGVSYGRVGTKINYLKNEKYRDFALYIIKYLDFLAKHNIEIYAISPQNEPEYPTSSWDGCVWFPGSLAYFVNKNLKPLLKQNYPDLKIIIGELSNWYISDLYLYILRLNNINSQDIDIIASHGYSSPQFRKNFEVDYETSPRFWFFNRKWKKNKWITEASSTLSYNDSFESGINMATSIHRFLENDVTAYIFWLAVVDKYSNEALLFDDLDQNKLIFSKVYYVFGQFTRWIRPGFVRVILERKFFDLDLTDQMVSMFLNEYTNDFVIVSINPSRKHVAHLNLDFNSAQVLDENSLVGYKTNNDSSWEPLLIDDFKLENNNTLLKVSIPCRTVQTIAGRIFKVL